MLGLPLFHVLVLIVQLIGIVVPFLLVTHARHARASMAITMLLTIIWFVLFLWFGHAPGRSDLVLLRSYAFGSALSSLADEVFSARDATMPTRFSILLPLFFFFLLTLACMIGGMSAKF